MMLSILILVIYAQFACSLVDAIVERLDVSKKEGTHFLEIKRLNTVKAAFCVSSNTLYLI